MQVLGIEITKENIKYIYTAIGILSGLFVAISALKTVERKNRSYFWVFLCFLFAPFFLILFFLPRKSWNPIENENFKKAYLQKCNICGNNVSSDSKRCPSCGTKNTLYERNGPKLIEFFSFFAVLSGSLFCIFIYLYSGVNPFIYKSQFPSCSSIETKNLSEKIYKNIPINHFLNKKIIAWKSIKEDRPGVCSANIISSSGNYENVNMEYKIESNNLILLLKITN